MSQSEKEIFEASMSSCGGSEPIALQVVDDSMEPEFKRGNIIILDSSAPVSHECYVVAMIENGPIFRQLLIDEGRYFIQPLNEAYMHERREIKFEAIHSRVVQQASPNGQRKERKHYL
ncbi:MAG: S24 family peptidase [Gammaproteobacteria bacterium]|nr:S24 family peptidase [Gammaproteobacteria bacterium]